MHSATKNARPGQGGARLAAPGIIDPFAGSGGLLHGHNPRALALDALHAIDAGTTRDEWFRAGAAARAAGLELEDIDAWSATAANYKGTKDVLAAFGRLKPDGPIGPGTLFFMARAQGWKPPRDGNVRKLRPRPAQAVSRPVAAPLRESLADYGRDLWSACKPISGPAREYLEARACVIPPEDGDLRMHPALPHPSGYVGPALVALVTDVVTREPLTLHRTWIRPDGLKAEVDPPRLLLGGHRKAGGCIRLWPDEAVSTSLAVAEGIESALSLAHAHQPVWSLIDAGNLAALPVLVGIECLLIGADHDNAGTKAARQCASRWHEAGARVYIVTPPQERTDLNNIAMEAA